MGMNSPDRLKKLWAVRNRAVDRYVSDFEYLKHESELFNWNPFS